MPTKAAIEGGSGTDDTVMVIVATPIAPSLLSGVAALPVLLK